MTLVLTSAMLKVAATVFYAIPWEIYTTGKKLLVWCLK